MRSVGLPITLSWSIGLVVAGVSNFMALAPRFGEHGGERALGQLQLECVVGGGRGIGEEPVGDGFGAARHLGLGGFVAPWLMRDTAERDTSAAIGLDDRADRDQRKGVGRPVAH